MKYRMYRKYSPASRVVAVALMIVLVIVAVANHVPVTEVKKGPCDAWLKHCDNGECREVMFENCIQTIGTGYK